MKAIHVSQIVYGGNHEETTVICRKIGFVYRKLGEDHKALENYFNALKISTLIMRNLARILYRHMKN